MTDKIRLVPSATPATATQRSFPKVSTDRISVLTRDNTDLRARVAELEGELTAVGNALIRAEQALTLGHSDPFGELRAWRCGTKLQPAGEGLGDPNGNTPDTTTGAPARRVGAHGEHELHLMCTITGTARITQLGDLCESAGVDAGVMVSAMVSQVLSSLRRFTQITGSLRPLEVAPGDQQARRHVMCIVRGAQHITHLETLSARAGFTPGAMASAIVSGILAAGDDQTGRGNSSVQHLSLVGGGQAS